ncbi:MAG: glutathione S-transferase family protein [Labrys sp. (in: a-proteobacteria)]
MPHRFALHALLGSGPSYKAALILALTGTPREYISVDLRSGAHKTPEYLAKNRYGQVPVLEDRELGLFICQAPVILEHVAETSGRFMGETVKDRIRSREWMFWEFDRLSRGIYRPRAVARGFWKLSEEVTAHYKGEGEAGLAMIESQLAGRDWLVAATPTFADVDLYGVVYYANEAGLSLDGLPNLSAWKARIEALPGYGTPAELQGG